MDSENQKSKKEIKVENGNGKELNISTVYEHIKNKESQDHDNASNKKREIVIPKGSSKKD